MRQPQAATTLFSDTVALIYDAAMDFDKWREALGAIRVALRADSAIVILPPDSTKLRALSLIHQGEQYYEVDDLLMMGNYRCPLATIEPERVIAISDLMPDERWRNSAFYIECCKPADVFDILCADIRLPSGAAYRTRFTRSETAQRFSKADRAFVSSLVPHLKHAFEMNVRSAQHALVHSQYVYACDRLGVATFILDGKGLLVDCNEAARGILSASDGLQASEGRLSAIDAHSNRELQRLIGKALDPVQKDASVVAGSIVPLVRTAGKSNLGVYVRRVSADECLGVGRHRPAVSIFVRDPDFCARAPADASRRLLNLTPAETGVALDLANGLSLAEAAGHLGIRQNTARAHLRAIFMKTGTQRQTDLVRAVLNSVAYLSGEADLPHAGVRSRKKSPMSSLSYASTAIAFAQR
jgi:DNA-binding CsgD family transcriptional regulator